MPSNLDFLKDTPYTISRRQIFSPVRTLTILAILIFLAEIVTMIILSFLPLTNYMFISLLDGLIMLVLILPGLYVLHLKPQLIQLEAQSKTQTDMRASEKLLRKVLDLLPVGVWIIDATGQIARANTAGQEIWAGAHYVGPKQYAMYKAWWPDSGKPVKPEEWAGTRAIASGETILNDEVNIEAFDGTPKIILNSAVPILDDDNELLGAVIVNQDITERRQMASSLMQTSALMERYFNSIHSLIAYMDRDFNFIRVNEAYARSAGHPPDYFPGKNHFELYPHPENEAIFRQVVESGEPFSVLEKPFEYVEFPERGVSYWDWSLQPVAGANGEVEGLAFSLVDVTERKRAELELERKNQELLELSISERRQRELAESLVRSAIALNSSLRLDEVLESILEQIRRAIPFTGADIVLVEGNTLHVAGYSGFEAFPDSKQAMERTHPVKDFPMLGQICSSLQPIIIRDTMSHPDWRFAPGMEWVRSYMGAPLAAGTGSIGVISLVHEAPNFFDEQSVEKLQVLAAPASVALRNARLYQAELDARQAAENLSEAAVALTQTLEVDHVLQMLMNYICGAVPSDVHGVGMFEGEDRLAVRLAHGYAPWTGPDHIFSFARQNEPDTLVNKLVATRKSQLVTNTAIRPLLFSDPAVEQVRSWLLTPIVSSDKAIGLVALGKTEPEFFTQGHVQMVEALVAQAAVAIQNAWLFQQVRSSSERLQSLTRQLVEIQESERLHIARELHDDAGQALSLLKLSLGRLEQDPECPPKLRQRLEELKGMADGVLEELHRLAVDLRPIALDHLGLVAALQQHAGNLDSDRLSVQFKARGFEGGRLPQDVETSLYRIVQEALSNVVRHAQASNVGILLEWDQGRVRIFVEDDGIGFDPGLPENSHRLGLVGMRERAEMFGGSLTIESAPGQGTSIIVEVPDASHNSYRG